LSCRPFPRRGSSEGTAVKLSNFGTRHAAVEGIVATGGGVVKLAEPDFSPLLDTTGTHPHVARCADAAGGLASASAALAALPGPPSLGDVTVGPGQDVVLTAAAGPGIGVITVDDLTLTGVPDGGGCDQLAQVTLDGPQDILVLNVLGKLSLKACGRIDTFGDQTIVNVVGPGPAVLLAKTSDIRPALLAPARNLTVKGAANSLEVSNFVGPAYVRKAKLAGYTVVRRGEFCQAPDL
jgi:hypothetical protein